MLQRVFRSDRHDPYGHDPHGYDNDSGARERLDELVQDFLYRLDGTADHGGSGTHHGGPSREELEIPWIISGPGIVPGKKLKGTVNTFDTAPTIAYVFGLTPPKCWIGKPVLEAFKSSPTH